MSATLAWSPPVLDPFPERRDPKGHWLDPVETVLLLGLDDAAIIRQLQTRFPELQRKYRFDVCRFDGKIFPAYLHQIQHLGRNRAHQLVLRLVRS